MKFIILKNSHHRAIVDDEDYDFLNLFNWNLRTFSCKKRKNFFDIYYSYQNEQKKHRKQKMSRLIFDNPKGMVIHINSNHLDNRKCNLIIGSNKEISLFAKARITGSGSRGVYYNRKKGKWISCISIGGKSIYLGSFCDKSKAENIYNKEYEKIIDKKLRR